MNRLHRMLSRRAGSRDVSEWSSDQIIQEIAAGVARGYFRIGSLRFPAFNQATTKQVRKTWPIIAPDGPREFVHRSQL